MSSSEMPSSAVGTLPHRTPGASGYRKWLSGDLGRVRVQVFTPAMDVPPMDPDDPEAWAHVAEVMNRPHIQDVKDTRREVAAPTTDQQC